MALNLVRRIVSDRAWFFKHFISFPHSVVLPLLGSGAPTDGTSGTGATYAGPGSIYIDYAAGTLYTNTNTKASPTWTAGAALSGAITATSVTSSGLVKSSSASAGIGYATGAGAAGTQSSSRTTTVVCNAISGSITLVSAAGSATPATFTVTNSSVAATDVIIVNQKSGTDKYEIFVTAVGAGSFAITSFTTGGTTTEQPVFNFAVIKAVAS